ncbi:MAG: amidohydrolase [Clostridiales bacterium]|nr:amidohydrolase [Clostridiales bacterium]
MYGKLKARAEELSGELVACRRDLHQFAELGWMEMRTSSLVAARLTEWGYEVITGRDVCLDEARMGLPAKEVLDEHYEWAVAHGADLRFVEKTRGGFTGVVGILHCGEGKTVAMRFDMDALPVFEKTDTAHRPRMEEFASCTDGVMHACGHDGHTTIGLGVARVLSEIREELSGTIKLIFQPAEEGVRGARSIVEHGHLDRVDYVLGSHLTASDDGKCHICPGMAGTFATTKLDAVFTGRAAHAGVAPEQGNNAMLAAATAVLNIQAIPRHGQGESRVNVGVLRAGTGRNVICDRAKLEIEVRGQTTEVNAYMEAYTRNILQASAMMHQCKLAVDVMGSSAAIECTPELVERIRQVCTDDLAIDVNEPSDMGGSEDFAYMTRHVISQGGMACFTGIQIPCAGVFHSAGFDFDERALPLGVAYYTGVVWNLLGR